MERNSEQTLSNRYIDDQYVYEKVLCMAYHYGNTSQNNNDILPYIRNTGTCQEF